VIVRHDALLVRRNTPFKGGDSREARFIPGRLEKFARAGRGQRVVYGSAQKGGHEAADSETIK
jgi:hypothetical protein